MLLKGLRVKAKHNAYLELKNATLEEQERQLDFCTKFKTLWQRKCPILFGGKRSKFKDLTKCEKFQERTITVGTYENFVLKSIVGFASGVFLTYIFFAFFVFQLNFSLSTATYLSSILGSVLSLGLAFSSSVRCVVLMLLPQMFSKRGRQALVAYAFILVFTGPAKNTMRNMRILSETMACTQGKLKEAVKSLVELIKRPFYAIKDTVTQVTEKIKAIVEKMKAMISSIKKSVLSIIGVIKNAFNWLNSVVGMCSKKVGTPFQRCIKVFEGAIDDCKVQLGSALNWMCSVAYVASHLCYAVKVFDFVCELIDFVSDSIVGQTKKKLQEFMFQVRNIFYVRIEFSHSFSISTEQSKSLKEITSGIMTEISQKTSAVFSFFDIMSFGFSFFFLWMVFQILNYRRKFMTNDAFDNRYITDKIIELDIKRTQLGRETILPLNIHERKKYAPISSIRLVQTEKKVIAKSAIFLGLSTLKLSLQILTDYCLYWILTMIRFHGQFQTHVDSPTSFNAQVNGTGMLSELYASVLNAFKPSNLKVDLDTGSCLPDPLPPDTMQYKQVATLMTIAWIICFTEPYGLRLRFVVMSYYHPERAQVRAVWLYNNIIRARGSFLKYARRQLRRKFTKGEDGIEEVSMIDRIRARCPLLRKIWKGKEFKACLLCGSLGSKISPLVKCPRNNCVGLFCVDCYATLQNLCTICRLPIEYGDLSDISEERDSSEDNMARKGKSERSETSETSNELNLAEALSNGESGSDLSYGYQFEERDPNEEIQVPLPHKDVEAQKPKDKVTINDFSVKLTEGKKYSMTLAERTKSGIWGFIPDSESMEARRRSHFSTYKEYMNQQDSRLSIATTPSLISMTPSSTMVSNAKGRLMKSKRRPSSLLLKSTNIPFYEEDKGLEMRSLGNYKDDFEMDEETKMEEIFEEQGGSEIDEDEGTDFKEGEEQEIKEGENIVYKADYDREFEEEGADYEGYDREFEEEFEVEEEWGEMKYKINEEEEAQVGFEHAFEKKRDEKLLQPKRLNNATQLLRPHSKKNEGRKTFDGGGGLLKLLQCNPPDEDSVVSSSSYHKGIVENPISGRDTYITKLQTTDILSTCNVSNRSSSSNKSQRFPSKSNARESILNKRKGPKQLIGLKNTTASQNYGFNAAHKGRSTNGPKNKNYNDDNMIIPSKICHGVSYQERKMSLKKRIVNDGATVGLHKSKRENMINRLDTINPLKSVSGGYECNEGQNQPNVRCLKTSEYRIYHSQVNEENKPEMIKRWIKSGNYHQTDKQQPVEQKGFIGTFIKGVNNISNVFSRKNELPPSDIKRAQNLKQQKKLNIFREKEKMNWGKHVKKGNNVWKNLFFWRNMSQKVINSSSSSSISEKEISRSIPPLFTTQSPPEDNCFQDRCLTINEKQPFHRMVHKPTVPQMVFDEFKIQEN